MINIYYVDADHERFFENHVDWKAETWHNAACYLAGAFSVVANNYDWIISKAWSTEGRNEVREKFKFNATSQRTAVEYLMALVTGCRHDDCFIDISRALYFDDKNRRMLIQALMILLRLD